MSVGTVGAIRTPPVGSGFLGQGVAYPLSYNAQGRLNLAYGPTLVEQSLQAIWETAPGERSMLPKFGAATGEFEPIDVFRLIARYKQNVAEYEPRVEEVEVDSDPGPGQFEVTVRVVYKLKGAADERTLTFPIFTGP